MRGTLILWIALVTFLETDLWRSAFFVLGGLIVLSPIVHYWYVSWALVFVPLFPSLAWITFSGTMALYFLVGLNPSHASGDRLYLDNVRGPGRP